jgi:hypothetical protein
MRAAMMKMRARRWLSAIRQDEGMALATVVAISAILFLLATTLVMLSTQQQVNGSMQLQRTKALHAADAGIDAYRYELLRDSAFNSVLSSRTADASWTVSAEPPGPGSSVTLLTAVGQVAATNNSPAVTRTVKATVRQRSFSDYMFLMNHYLNLGAGGLVKGNVRSNEYVNNDGEITGYVYAGSYISGSGVFRRLPLHPNYGTQSFAVVDYGRMQSLATGDGTYYPDAGTYGTGASMAHYLGYSVTFSGLGGTIAKVRSVSTTTGVMVADAPVSFTTPPNGVLYFDDPVWVGGSYGRKVTIAVGKQAEDADTGTYGRSDAGISVNPAPSTTNGANSSVYLWNNLQSANSANPDIVCGIVTRGDISITSELPDPPTPTNLTIQAALLSTAGSIHADWGNRRLKNHLRILGAMAQWDSGFIRTTGTYEGHYDTLGFSTRDYWYDPNLDITTPPNFPPLGSGGLNIKTWVEH